MFKIYSKLFISLFLFVSFLNASTDKLNQQIFELKTSQEFAQKLNDEKITLIMGQIIQKENEIKELKNELERYIKKEELEKEINYQNNRIEDINSHVDKLSVSITMFGIFITAVIIIFTGTFFYVSNKKHLEKIDEWIEKNQDKILDPIRKEANELQNNIEKQALDLYQEQLKKLNIQDKLNEGQKENQKEILEKVNEILENKEKEEYTYDDWRSKYFDMKNKKKYNRALVFIRKAIKHAISDYEKANSLFDEAFCLGEMKNEKKNLNSSIDKYNALIEKFKDTKEERILNIILRSYYNLGVTYSDLDMKEDLLKTLTKIDNDSYFNSTNLSNSSIHLLIDIKNLLASKLVQYNEDFNGSLKILNALIKKYKNNENIAKEAILSVIINKFEVNLFLNKENSQEDLDFYLLHVSPENLNLFEMLEVLKAGQKSNQDDMIDKWKTRFKKIPISWSFLELKIWANSFEDEKVKERLLRYIDIFENHNKNIKN